MELIEILGKAKALADFDSNAAIVRCRQFVEALTSTLADGTGTDIAGMPLVDQINVVGPAAGLSTRSIRSLHSLRIHGNKAAHHHLSGEEEARYALALGEEILAAALEAVPSLATASAPDATLTAEPDPLGSSAETSSVLRSVHLLVMQYQVHHVFSHKITAQASQQVIPQGDLMILTTAGVAVRALQDSGLIPPEINSLPLQRRNDMAGLGCLGFRWGANDIVKLISPPEGPITASLGLSPPGAAYFNALCSFEYWHGSLSTQDIQQHILRALSLTRTDWLERQEWPKEIPFGELSVATRTAFQWTDSIRRLLGKTAPRPAQIWSSLIDKHAPGWSVSLKTARPY